MVVKNHVVYILISVIITVEKVSPESFVYSFTAWKHKFSRSLFNEPEHSLHGAELCNKRRSPLKCILKFDTGAGKFSKTNPAEHSYKRGLVCLFLLTLT